MVQIEYDPKKNTKNIHKHHISIPELATIFDNPFSSSEMDIPDKKYSKHEKRFHAYGWTTSGWYVLIWYCYRGDKVIRIIGGRKLK